MLAMEREVGDELLLLLCVEMKFTWMKSEIWLVCWSVPKYREGILAKWIAKWRYEE